ncbi:MAG: hypothetical protein OXR07_07440 [Nitrospira sp.]|nr:hypothetical protein [Nitrospira sp.]MDD9860499.1 hypothetical protein [Nitrospira sp.]
MDNTTQVVKHLEMIQEVINRLGHDSFLIKGWSMAILAAGILFIARGEVQSEMVVLAFLIPVVGFWMAIFSGKSGCSGKFITRLESKTVQILP